MKPFVCLLVLAFATLAANAQITLQHQVLSVYPPQNATSVPIHDSLVVQFAPELNILPQSLSDTTFVIQGQQSGWHRGAVTFDPQTHSATLKPVKPFFVGELVTAVATKFIQFDSVGEVKNIRGFAWQFYGKVTKQTRATFSEQTRFSTGDVTAMSNIVDLDGDARPDLCFGRTQNTGFFFNRGGGSSFDTLDVPFAGRPLCADFDLTGHMEAVVGYDSGFVVHLTPDRTFTLGEVRQFHMRGGRNAVVDIDFDGRPEVMGLGVRIGSVSDDSLNVYGVKGDVITRSQTKWADDISGIAAGDFNNDGAIDVIVAAVNGMILFLNDGTGHLQDGITLQASGPAPICAADMDRDGWLDVVGPLNSGVGILHNNHDLTFSKHYFNDEHSLIVYGCTIGDLDGDGLMDAVYTPYLEDSMFVFVAHNQGNDLFVLSQNYSAGTNLGRYTDDFSGDLTGDSALDIVVSCAEVGTVLVLRNDSTIKPLAVVENGEGWHGSTALQYTFPNPTKGLMQILYWFPTTQNVILDIFDLNGYKVATVQEGVSLPGVNKRLYDTSSLISGTYFLELHSSSNTTYTTFQVTR